MRELVLLVFGILIISLNGHAQILNFKKIPHATTYGWSFKNKIQILDRSHSYDYGIYDRGFGAVQTLLTSHEYEMDILTYNYRFTDAFIWDKFGSGSKTHFGSITKSRLALFTEITQEVSLSSKSNLNVDIIIQEDARAKRAYFEFGYQFKVHPNHSFEISHNFSEYKKDMDATLSYILKQKNLGTLKLSFTAQNYINNFVNDVGSSGFRRRDIFEKTYSSFPMLLTARYQSDDTRFWYLDVSGALQPKIKGTELSTNDATYELYEEENLSFLNASLSFRFWRLVTGGYIYADNNDLFRSASTTNPLNGFYSSSQNLKRVGFFAYGYFNRFSPHLVLSIEEYKDNQSGTDFSISVIPEPLDYVEDRVLLDVGSSFSFFDSKLNIMVKYLSGLRESEAAEARKIREYINRDIPTRRRDNRINLSFQIQAHEKIFFELGAGYDLDGDKFGTTRYFDKGFGKLIIEF